MKREVIYFIFSNPGYMLFLIVWQIWTLAQNITVWVASRLFSIQHSTSSPVKVYRVLIRKKLIDAGNASTKDFLSLYWGNVPVDYLKGNTISIYCLCDNHIYFVDTDPAINIHDSDTSPFVYLAQWRHAQKLLAVPVNDFIKFARNLEETQVNVLLLSNSGRCGSTLLAQMLEATGSVLQVSEPDILTDLHINHFNRSLTDDCIGEILNASFRFYASMAHNHGDYKAVVLKPRAICMSLVPLTYKHTPWVQHLYMYRQGHQTLASMFSSNSTVPDFISFMNDKENCLIISKHIGMELRGQTDKVTDLITWMILQLAGSYVDFHDFYFKQKIPMYSIRYEDVIKQPKEHLRAINTHYSLGLNENQISQGLRALERDAQRGTSIGKNNLVRTFKDKFEAYYTPVHRQKGDEICQALGVPPMNSNETLPGALPINAL